VELNGARLFPANRLVQLRHDFVGRRASQANLLRLQAQITSWYDQAKLLTQVGVPRYGSDGIVSVYVVEARLGAVRVDHNRSAIMSGWAIATVLDAVVQGREMRLDKLESALLKLNDLGGVQVRAVLAPGKEMGTTDVVLALKATRQVQGEVSLNNYVTQYTGPYQAQASVNFGGLLGRGETFVVDGAYSGNVDWYGSRHWAANGIVPLTPGGLNWIGGYRWSDYRLLQDFAVDNFVGDYMAGEVGLSQVLWRRPKANLVARAIGEVDAFNDNVLGYEYSNRTNWVGRFSLAGDVQDKWLGGVGLNSGLLTLSLGNLSKLAPGEADLDADLMGTAGSWGKIHLLVDRYQMFKGSRWSLELFGQAQGAFNNLEGTSKNRD
jgi:hemolysin activation/secretion protein